MSASEGNAALDWICKSLRSNEHWRPSKTLAKHLGVPYARLLVANPKEDTANLVWCSVLALAHCATRFANLHEVWYDAAEAATAWLHQQKRFVDNREALAESACDLLGLHDRESYISLLTSVFRLPSSEAERGELGDWKECFLDEPPYASYYWNEKTNHSTWRHPLERARAEQEQLEREEKHRIQRERLEQFLPARLPINRDAVALFPSVLCSLCAVRGDRPRPATVCCLACADRQYYCDSCCDLAHSTRDKLVHVEQGSLRFVECLGIDGFATIRAASIETESGSAPINSDTDLN